ncbi:MAG: hypothetical protein JXQ90_21090 [Cyclobacteriaceae bacterium]
MNRCFIILLVVALLAGNNVLAQITTNVSLSPKYQAKVGKAKTARERLKRYRKYQDKEARKQAKEEEKQRRKAQGKKIASDSVNALAQTYTGQPVPDIPDSGFQSREDSIEWITQTLLRYAPAGEYQSWVNRVRADSMWREALKQEAVQRGETTAQQWVMDNVEDVQLLNAMNQEVPGHGEFLAAKGKGESYIAQGQGYQAQGESYIEQGQGYVDQGQQMVREQQWKQLSAKDAMVAFQKYVPAPQLGQVMKEMQGLKRKYVSFPGLNQPGEPIKRSSMEGYPFAKRLYYGGNVSGQVGDSTVIQVDLQLGYQLNKKWVIGIGGVAQERIRFKNFFEEVDGDAWGYSAFTNHDLVWQLYAHAEYQRMGVRQETEEGEGYDWQTAVYAGIGREISLFNRVNLTITILYDFNHKNNELHKLPFVTRIGYRVK